ncbi:hypothetical protein BCR43DRAFT_440613, partial [Syncephalastrum racemosum]
TATDIRKAIENRGYKCVYLPAHSQNTVEQLWMVRKSKSKREKLLGTCATFKILS